MRLQCRFFLFKSSFFTVILNVNKFQATHGDLRTAALELLSHGAVTLPGLGRLDDANLLAQRKHLTVCLRGEGRGRRGPIGYSSRRGVPSARGRNLASPRETTTAAPGGFTPGRPPRR